MDPFQIFIELRNSEVNFAAIGRIDKTFMDQLSPQRGDGRDGALHLLSQRFCRTRQSAAFYHRDHEIQFPWRRPVMAHFEEAFVQTFLEIRIDILNHDG